MSVPTLTGTISGSMHEYDMLPYDQQRAMPAVSNYRYTNNISIRSSANNQFRWEEVYLEETDNGLGYLMPIGYVIQISPDMGYGSPMEHFASTNPFFKQTDLLSIDNGVLSSEEDGSVLATLDASAYKRLLHDFTIGKYYWRAVAITEDGSNGELGYPTSFYYRKTLIDNEWTLTTTSHITNKPNIFLQGTKSSDILDIEINDILNIVSFPDKNSWQANINLSPGTNRFFIRAKDIVGNFSSYKEIVINYEQENASQIGAWNHFDEFGLLVGLKRIFGEDNYNFKNRILDVALNPGGIRYNGILNGAIRETNSRRVSDAIRILLYQKQPNTNYPIISVDSASIIIEHDSFFINDEKHIVDPFTKGFVFNKNITDESNIVLKYNNKIIDREEYFIDYISNSLTLKKDYPGKILSISYTYAIELRYIDYPTIADIIYKLNELTYDSVNRIFIVELSESLTGNEPSENLIMTDRLIVSDIINIQWSEIMLREIGDKYWKFSMINDRGTYFGSRWLGFVKQMKNLTRSSWEYVVLDISTWDSGIVNNEPQAFVTRQYDTYMGSFENNGIKYDPSRAYALGYLNPTDNTPIKWNGPLRWKSGVGYQNDLYVSIAKLEKVYRNAKGINIYITNTPNFEETENRA